MNAHGGAARRGATAGNAERGKYDSCEQKTFADVAVVRAPMGATPCPAQHNRRSRIMSQ